MSKIFNYETTAIIIARYKEDIEWINKINNFKNVHIYEKEKPDKDPYNIPKNKGSEASAYIKYIIDNYNNTIDLDKLIGLSKLEQQKIFNECNYYLSARI
jgi:hypothetical protein